MENDPLFTVILWVNVGTLEARENSLHYLSCVQIFKDSLDLYFDKLLVRIKALAIIGRLIVF